MVAFIEKETYDKYAMRVFIALLLLVMAVPMCAAEKPWENGRLTVRGQYLVHENGVPFFWLGNTAWLLPERLNRDEVEFYLTREAEEGYNVEQIQVIDSNYPTFNVFGQQAFDDTFDMEKYAAPQLPNSPSTPTGTTWTILSPWPSARASILPWTASGAAR